MEVQATYKIAKKWQSSYGTLHRKDKSVFIEAFCNIEGISTRAFHLKKAGERPLTREEQKFAEDFFGVNR